MLYKDLISIYGSSLAGKSAPKNDPVWSLSWSEDLQVFREYALGSLQQAKVYLLDHLAASYADTLHDALQGNAQDDSVAPIAMLGEITLPETVTWVEFDYRELLVARFERGSLSTAHYDEPIGSGLHGYLIDDRNSDHLRVTMFSRPEGSKIMDPICSLLVNRAARGSLNYDDAKVDLNWSMVNFYDRIGKSKEEIKALRELHYVDTGDDLFIPFALFAMLVSPDLGGIIPAETDTFKAKDTKTARKFGKSWILGAQKSHLTIRIGPQAAAHMREKQQRLEFERQSRNERSGPVRHWVSEHERRYSDGKVVLIKGHHRGQKLPISQPTRVMGPKSNATDFGLAPKN